MMSPPKCITVENFAFESTKENYLGEGGYGYVYKGYNRLKPYEHVAVKTISSEKLKKQELQLIRSVRSEYLVRIFLICSQEEITYIVMELCDGDLSGYLHRFSKLDWRDATLLADNLARGYKVLEMHKIVHRDIKPQNILIKYDRHCNRNKNYPVTPTMDKIDAEKWTIAVAKLSDFGTSRMLTDDQSELSNVAGTLFYMAPEVGANLVSMNMYDHSADMWSIGCVLYECLTGLVPFDEATLCKLFLNVACKNSSAFTCGGGMAAKLSVPVCANGSTNRYGGGGNFSIRQFDYVTSTLLHVDPKQRMTPEQFFDRAVADMRRLKPFSAATKLNVRHRLSAVGRDETDLHSKSFTYILSCKDSSNDNNVINNGKVRAKSERRSYDGCVPCL